MRIDRHAANRIAHAVVSGSAMIVMISLRAAGHGLRRGMGTVLVLGP
jgi:hypothetical protein